MFKYGDFLSEKEICVKWRYSGPIAHNVLCLYTINFSLLIREKIFPTHNAPIIKKHNPNILCLYPKKSSAPRTIKTGPLKKTWIYE